MGKRFHVWAADWCAAHHVAAERGRCAARRWCPQPGPQPRGGSAAVARWGHL